jgi:hypothetical protein
LAYIDRNYEKTLQQAFKRGLFCEGTISDCQYCGTSLDVNSTQVH